MIHVYTIGGNGRTHVCAALCSSSISHITLTTTSPQSPYGHSSQCHSNADSSPWSVPVMSLCVCVCVCVNAFIYAYALKSCYVCLSDCICLDAFMHVVFFSIFKGLQIFFSLSRLLSEGTREMKVCRCSDRESRHRGVGRSQEQLSSSNRQRAKRMTVPSSSLSVNMIMFEPSFRSKACHTTCKTGTKGTQIETY